MRRAAIFFKQSKGHSRNGRQKRGLFDKIIDAIADAILGLFGPRQTRSMVLVRVTRPRRRAGRNF
jgi:hypothetical protein